jgi:hypothetical protein
MFPYEKTFVRRAHHVTSHTLQTKMVGTAHDKLVGQKGRACAFAHPTIPCTWRYARNTPPVRLPTSATIFLASTSISSSVIVFSRGCSVTAIAIDFLSGSIPAPS